MEKMMHLIRLTGALTGGEIWINTDLIGTIVRPAPSSEGFLVDVTRLTALNNEIFLVRETPKEILKKAQAAANQVDTRTFTNEEEKEESGAE